jgi:hypothetical protein
MSKKPRVKADPEFNVEAYGQELTKSLLAEIFKILKTEDETHGSEFADQVLFSFFTSMITTMVYNSLTAGRDAPVTEAEQYEISAEALAQIKSRIEECTATGFSAAFHTFDPRFDPEYVCEIECVDDGLDTGRTH